MVGDLPKTAHRLLVDVNQLHPVSQLAKCLLMPRAFWLSELLTLQVFFLDSQWDCDT